MASRFTEQERWHYLQQYGSHCMAYSTLQPDMEYFDLPGVGYLAYMTHGPIRFVLGEPICAEADKPELIARALEEHPKTCFVQVREPTARHIHQQHGFYATQMGVEIDIDLASFTTAGRGKQLLRSSCNILRAQGALVRELHQAQTHWRTLQEISDTWLQTRRSSRQEMAFLARPLTRAGSVRTRTFVIELQGQIRAFLQFDPMFCGGAVRGWYPDILRSLPGFRRGVYYPLVLHALEVFRKEGTKHLCLGLAPLHTEPRTPLHGLTLSDVALRVLYTFGNRFYHFKGVAFTKTRFQGEPHPVYAVHCTKSPFVYVFRALRLCRII